MDKTDYEEPTCPMDNSMWVKRKVVTIPLNRLIAKEDEYLGKHDYEGALRHLLYWLAEARQGNDDNGELVIYNELMGLNRKMGNKEKAMEYANKALAMVEKLGHQDTITGSTTYLNMGTVYKAFNEPEKSLYYFKKAKDIYETKLATNDERKAGLYNNMALTLVDLGRFEEAKDLYLSAIDIVKHCNQADEAISWLNLADLVCKQKGLEEAKDEIHKYLDIAKALLEGFKEDERDSYYAYVCEKCAPTFDHYGYFVTAGNLRIKAQEIYEKNNESK